MSNPPDPPYQQLLPPVEPSDHPAETPLSVALADHAAARQTGARWFSVAAFVCLLLAAVGFVYLGRFTATALAPVSVTPQVRPAVPLAQEGERERLLAENLMLKRELEKAEAALASLEASLAEQAVALESARSAAARREAASNPGTKPPVPPASSGAVAELPRPSVLVGEPRDPSDLFAPR